MIDIANISIVIVTASVIIGIIIAIFELRDLAQTRHTELIIKLNPSLNVSGSELFEALPEVWNRKFNDYNEYLKKYEPGSDKAFNIIVGYIDGIGFLLKRRLIDIETVDYLLSGSQTIWEEIEPIVEGMRKQYDMPELFKWFEYLYKEMKRKKF
jgi:hypothetical protein